MGRPEIEIDRVEDITPAQWSVIVGKDELPYDNEQDYTQWLVDNKDILLRVIGLEGDGLLRVNQPIEARGLRPDIWLETEDAHHVIEVKCTTGK